MGAKIYLYYEDHNPPHVHVVQSEHMAEISIETQELIEGEVPPQLRKQIARWIRKHSDDLMERWDRASKGAEFEAISEGPDP